MKDPVDHVLRPSLPWRQGDGAITECGYDASKVKAITRGEYFQRVKDLGQQRAAMITCVTCANTARNHGSWEDDPRQAVSREIMWEGSGRWAHSGRGQRLKDELIAIAALVEAHRDEFDASIRAGEGRREWLEKKAAHERKPKPSTSRSL